jgi:arsenical pump membrane protein
MFKPVAGLVILAAVLIVVVWRPRLRWWPHGMPVFIPATVGAVFALALGLLDLQGLTTIFLRVWDASLTLVGLFMLAAALEVNHFFEWAALRIAHMAGGSRWRLYVLLCLLTIGVTICLGNDGAILGMTAIGAKLVKRVFPRTGSLWLMPIPKVGSNGRGGMKKTFPKGDNIWWPYIFATGFLADSFSGFLVPDNLTNIIVASTYHLPFIQFMLQMSLPMIMAAAVAIACFAVRFRSVLFKESYDLVTLEKPESVLPDRMTFNVSRGALAVLIAGHLIIGGVFHQPVVFVVGPVALFVLLFSHFRKIKLAHEIAFDAPWDVLLYALGMFVVVTAALSTDIVNLLVSVAHLHELVAGGRAVSTNALGIFLTGWTMAILSGLINNLPATLVGVVLLLGAGAGTGANAPFLPIYAVILGVDIGPKLTPYGSLATLMWLSILKREEVNISWGQCFKENWPVTVFALGTALLVLLGLALVGLV